MYRFKKYNHLLFAVLFLFSTKVLLAQDSTYVEIFDFIENSKIHWVGQIPPLKEDVKTSKKGWLKNLIFGKKPISTYQKPVQVIASDPANSIVLDQGYGTVLFTKDENFTIPKVLRKEKYFYPSLVDACLLPNNTLLFTDSKLNNIYMLSEDAKNLTMLNEQLDLKQPTGIAYSKLKNQIWVVETAAHHITILDNKGHVIKTIGNRGVGPSEFNYPTSIWIDKKGTAYVVDALNYRIQIFDADGNFVSMFGENGNGTGFLARPKGIATDSFGHIYVVDALFHGVQIFDANGNYLQQFGKQGRATEEFWMPSGIFIDNSDRIYIADSYNARIQIFELIYTE